MVQFNIDPFPILKTDRIRLRRVILDDVKPLFVMRSDVNAMKYIGRPIAESIKDAEDLIHRIDEMMEKETAVHWAITLKGNDKLIGTIGFWQLSKQSRRTEIGYMLQSDFHRQGIMQEALNLVMNYAFEVMNLHSVEARTSPDNSPSIKILERNGFVKEGHLIENFYFNDKFWDTFIFSKRNKYGI
ncbi:MAG: GNAT family N-acetyltransferase [Saprospiraceae bacterium]